MFLPDVSIIIPTFNRAERICKAVETCFNGSDCAVEVVIVDDGSTDNTKEVLWKIFRNIFYNQSHTSQQSLQSNVPQTSIENNVFPKVHYCFQKNQGACASRNLGLQVATGKYVKFLDSDDELIPGSLSKELSFARKTDADVVVTGWQEKEYDANLGIFTITRHVSAPNMERGIDDMLLGRAPCISAALYRRSSIEKLKWDQECHKAQDWMWAWTVCLAGASFKTLDIESSIYNQHRDQRVSSAGQPFIRSTESRQHILRMVENRLRDQGQLSMDRRCALVQYYYKDSKSLCEIDPKKWQKLWLHCQALAPGYMPVEHSPKVSPIVRFLGPYWGVWLYVKMRKYFRLMNFRHPRTD